MTEEERAKLLREVDALVAEKVMGWKLISDGTDGMAWFDENGQSTGYGQGGGYGWTAKMFAPSTEIGAAWMVVGKLNAMGLDVHLNTYARTVGRQPLVLVNDGATSFRAQATAAPLAICIAALKAVGTDLSDNA